MKYCYKCGAQNADESQFCSKCGTNLVQPEVNQYTQINYNQVPPTTQNNQVNYVVNTSNKKRLTAFLLCLLLGFLGAHHFYVGNIGKGILYLCTLGFCFIGPIIDLFKILLGTFKDNVGMPLRQWN